MYAVALVFVIVRVARWYMFRPKNHNLIKFLEGIAMEDVGIFWDTWSM
jgi:hypothetical protein